MKRGPLNICRDLCVKSGANIDGLSKRSDRGKAADED